MSSIQNLQIYSTLSNAIAVKTVDQTVITAKWNARKASDTQEAADAKTASICLGTESLGILAGTPETYRELIIGALTTAAEKNLKMYVDEFPSAGDIPANYFTQTALIECFVGAGLWIEKERLETLFTASKTWQTRVASASWSNAQYQTLCRAVFADYVSVAGKKTRMVTEKAQTLLAKLHEDDLSTECGVFIARRLNQIINRKVEEVDLNAF